MSERTALDVAFKDAGGTLGVFGGKAGEYASARPDYPQSLYRYIEQQLTRGTPLVIADVGAGTGLLTRGWLARGHDVIAVEPNDAMRSAADALLKANPRYCSVAAVAEATGLADASVDLVTAAQAFHWFDPDRFRAECLRILRPHGQVALIWNDRAEDPLNDALTELFVAFGGEKRAAMVASSEKDENIGRLYGTTHVVEWATPHMQLLDAAGLAALVFSRSFMPKPDTQTGRHATDALAKLFAAHAFNGIVRINYRTRAVVGRPAGAR